MYYTGVTNPKTEYIKTCTRPSKKKNRTYIIWILELWIYSMFVKQTANCKYDHQAYMTICLVQSSMSTMLTQHAQLCGRLNLVTALYITRKCTYHEKTRNKISKVNVYNALNRFHVNLSIMKNTNFTGLQREWYWRHVSSSLLRWLVKPVSQVSVCPSVRPVSTCSKPWGSKTAGPTSMKLGTYILLVWRHSF